MPSLLPEMNPRRLRQHLGPVSNLSAQEVVCKVHHRPVFLCCALDNSIQCQDHRECLHFGHLSAVFIHCHRTDQF